MPSFDQRAQLHKTWPPPPSFGLPAQYTAWRPGQPEAISAAMDSPKRFTALVLPTGFGKSMVYMALTAISSQRSAILTATRALQSQLERDFGELGAFVSVKGQQNYLCAALQPGGEHYQQFGHSGHDTFVDQAPCHLGVDCSLKANGCSYFDTVRRAHRADILTTNYAWWLTLINQPQIHIRPERLILDEAHDAPDALADAIGSTISGELVGRVLSERLPQANALEPAAWVAWAREREGRLLTRLEGTAPRTREAVTTIRRGQLLLRSLSRVANMPPHLIVHRDELGDVRFDLVWAAPYADAWLFRGVKQIVLTSATMTRHTCDLLGIIEKDLDFYEAGDGFPVKRRPVYIAPAKADLWGKPLRVDHRMTRDHQLALVEHIDAIIDTRLDRKGIIHTVSYQRRDLLLAHSRHAARMLTHDKRTTADTIAQFKAAGPGAILVSPSVTTGYDFPYCAAPNTRVLTADLRWVPAATLRVGQKIAAFDELPEPGSRARRWRTATVSQAFPLWRVCYELELSDGTILRCSEDHPWLVSRSGVSEWVQTKDLRADAAMPSRLVRLLDVWDTDTSWEAGYLAGLYDGEASLSYNKGLVTLGFHQNEGGVLDRVTDILDDLGFATRRYGKGSHATKTQRMSHRWDVLRFLGQIRPLRLLDKLDLDKFSSLRMKATPRVVRKTYIGQQEVVGLSTTTRTFIAEGLASHNTDCEYQILMKIPFPDSRDPIVQARSIVDTRYPNHVAMQTLVQTCGRPMRAEDDQAETFVCDGHALWFLAKNADLAPRWFRKAITRLEAGAVPTPPRPLAPRTA